MSSKLSVIALVTLPVLLLACSGEDGAKGEPGAPGAPGAPGTSTPGGGTGDPSARFVVPNKGVLDREIDVTVSGALTKFDANSELDFGPGITVVSKSAISPTSLAVKIKIDKTAALGPRDVKVAGLVAAKAFDVKPGINVKAAGAAQQGGLGAFELENLDDRQFDTSNFRVSAAGLVAFGAAASGPFAGQGIVLVPPLAPPAKVQVVAENLGSDGKPFLSFYSTPDAFTYTARAATALAAGTAKTNETFANALDAKLYKITAPASTLVTLKMHVNEDQLTSLSTVLWGAGGKATDLLTRLDATEDSIFGPLPKEAPYDHLIKVIVPAGAAKDFFLTALDTSGENASKFDLVPSAVATTTVDEAAGVHDAKATAQAVTVAPVGQATLLKGEITDAKQDWYKFNVAAGEIIEISLDTASAGGQAGVNDGASFVAVVDGGPTFIGAGATTETLTAGEHFLVVATDKGKYTLSVRRVAAP